MSALGLEQAGDGFAHQIVVLGDDDPDRHAGRLRDAHPRSPVASPLMRVRRTAAFLVVAAVALRRVGRASPGPAAAGFSRADHDYRSDVTIEPDGTHRGARDHRLRLRRRAAPRHLPRHPGADRLVERRTATTASTRSTSSRCARPRARPRSTPSRTTATTSASRSAIPTATITGAHTYDITYRVRGALNGVRRPRRAGVERRSAPTGRCRSSRRRAVVHAPADDPAGRLLRTGRTGRRCRARRPTFDGTDRDVRAGRSSRPFSGHDGQRSRSRRVRSCRRPRRSSRSGSTSPRRSG